MPRQNTRKKIQSLISIDGLLDRIGIRKKESVGIAFGGGGAKGFSHIGVLMALNEAGIYPDVISGVSAGSIAAVLYAAGLTPGEMRECFAEFNKINNYREWAVPKEGLFKLNKFGKLLDSWLPVKNLEELKIPTVVCATNIDKGTQVGWCKGEIVPRVLASCSMPIIFKPQRINGAHYVDGGVLHNLPAWAIRDYCSTLWGVNCSPLDRNYKYKDSILDIAIRTYSLMSRSNILPDMNLCDYVVVPDSISNTKTFDLGALDKNIELGYMAACKILNSIRRD